jgi:hypothetical protein
MELRDFISSAIVEIFRGVEQAKEDLADKHGAVNPFFGPNMNSMKHEHLQFVEFDIAVTANEKTEGSAKAGVSVLGVELGGNGGKSLENSTVSRVKFRVPIIPPVTLVTPSIEGQ